LVLIGFEAYENLTLSRARPWVQAYKWPIYYFIAVAFWNLVGAGLFGFFINPPIALYYMQGLNTTSVHGHTALFGVYGMLGLGLMLFCLRGLTRRRMWKTRALAFSFWAINIGLALMVLLSLLPIGLMQTLGECGTRHLVRPFGGIHVAGDHRHLCLAQNHRRHHFRRRSAGSRLVHPRPEAGWSLHR